MAKKSQSRGRKPDTAAVPTVCTDPVPLVWPAPLGLLSKIDAELAALFPDPWAESPMDVIDHRPESKRKSYRWWNAVQAAGQVRVNLAQVASATTPPFCPAGGVSEHLCMAIVAAFRAGLYYAELQQNLDRAQGGKRAAVGSKAKEREDEDKAVFDRVAALMREGKSCTAAVYEIADERGLGGDRRRQVFRERARHRKRVSDKR